MDSDHSNDPSTKWGKGMMFMAWGIGLVMLTVFFGKTLDKQYNPNQTPQTNSTVNGNEVRLQRNKMGHYVANGIINGQVVTFMLDTGATNVSVPSHLGRRLGLQPGATFTAQTANGTVRVASTTIQHLELGNIVLNNVNASLNPGMTGSEILLGMSALKQLEFTQRGDLLILRQY